jgi:hypothetical protein
MSVPQIEGRLLNFQGPHVIRKKRCWRVTSTATVSRRDWNQCKCHRSIPIRPPSGAYSTVGKWVSNFFHAETHNSSRVRLKQRGSERADVPRFALAASGDASFAPGADIIPPKLLRSLSRTSHGPLRPPKHRSSSPVRWLFRWRGRILERIPKLLDIGSDANVAVYRPPSPAGDSRVEDMCVLVRRL